ncbi:hypothetical protein SAMN05192529_13818 [Arachidicoccus rhizosphaerae]|uniref:Molybdenum ABC transporter permease n=1 Tax=Arachidicoccus rhizosphaerae TaxID=551991 RepID=A0A1H4CXC8_9BACT|nr:hypothetical protein SAMN05192529_13818 [Arachidicoccus rhizosphaerae]
MLHQENLAIVASASKAGGLLLIILGGLITYHVGKRRFKRRNQFGLEVYESFESASISGCYNKIMRLAGIGCIFLGIILFLTGKFTQHIKVQQPVTKQHQRGQSHSSP